MKAFHCDQCGNLLFFENVLCLRCNYPLGFIPELIDLCALEPLGAELWKPVGKNGPRVRRCRSGIDFQACNWMVSQRDQNLFCEACRLNLIIPDLSFPENLYRWQKLESAKRRVLYSFLRLQLPISSEGDQTPLRFQFLADLPGSPVATGHYQGIITINISEADDSERERRRAELAEPFRTLLGHLRHEIAHYFWDRLVAGSGHLDSFRELFGDERQNYAECLQRHYEKGPPPNWQNSYVSAYASSHPWEDWAESWAHYFHITDALETAASFGLSLRPGHPQARLMQADPGQLMATSSEFEEILRHWVPLTHALNELNRGMGLPDLYPFVLSNTSLRKLKFVHSVLLEAAR